MKTIVIQNMAVDVLAVSVIRRSAASRGLMAIRFSCCDNQFTVFMNRSRLPSMPEVGVRREIGVANRRDSRLGLGALPRFRRIRCRRGVRLLWRWRRHGGRNRDRDRTGYVALLRFGCQLGRILERGEVGLRPAALRRLDERLPGATRGRVLGRRDRAHEREHRDETEVLRDRVSQGTVARLPAPWRPASVR